MKHRSPSRTILGCVVVALAVGASADAARKPAVTVRGASGGVATYRKTFTVTSCRPAGAHAVMLVATDGEDYELAIEAKRLPGRLVISGGVDEEAAYIEGKVTAVGFAGPRAARKITVAGRFVPGGIPGTFTVTGACP